MTHKEVEKAQLNPTAFSKTTFVHLSYHITTFPVSGRSASQHIVHSMMLGSGH